MSQARVLELRLELRLVLYLALLSICLLTACRPAAPERNQGAMASLSATAAENPSAGPAPCGEVLAPVEPVVLLGQPQLRIKARIDTGADLASLDLNLARRLGLDQPVIREITIRNAHGSTRRPVVRLKFMLRGQVRSADVSLYPRDGLDHPLLLGRQSLKGFLVDPAAECEGC